MRGQPLGVAESAAPDAQRPDRDDGHRQGGDIRVLRGPRQQESGHGEQRDAAPGRQRPGQRGHHQPTAHGLASAISRRSEPPGLGLPGRRDWDCRDWDCRDFPLPRCRPGSLPPPASRSQTCRQPIVTCIVAPATDNAQRRPIAGASARRPVRPRPAQPAQPHQRWQRPCVTVITVRPVASASIAASTSAVLA